MNSCELVSFVTLIACSISKCVPKEDLPLLTAIFGQLASTLSTIIEQDDLIEKSNTPPPIIEPTIESNNALLVQPNT